MIYSSIYDTCAYERHETKKKLVYFFYNNTTSYKFKIKYHLDFTGNSYLVPHHVTQRFGRTATEQLDANVEITHDHPSHGSAPVTT